MKQTFFIAIISLVIYSCNSTDGTKTKINSESKPVTVMAFYDTGYNGKPIWVMSAVLRVIKDSMKFVSVDANTQKKKVSIDTAYYIPTTKTYKSIAGKDSAGIEWRHLINERILRDGGAIDTIISNYKQK